MPCRVNNQRKKLGRLLLESKLHDHTTFVTLTYRDEELTYSNCDGDEVPVLVPAEAKECLVRLRTNWGAPYRYFLVGEYGTRTWRPHYHAILFGLSQTDLEHKNLLEKAWGKGFVQTGESNVDRLAYVAGYCLKKLTREADLHLGGRPPEFTRQSLKPGLGAGMVEWLSGYYTSKGGAMYLAAHGDICRTFRHSGKIYPLDYYILQKIRRLVGLSESAANRQLAGPPLELTPEYKEHLVQEQENYYVSIEKSRKAHTKMRARQKNRGTL